MQERFSGLELAGALAWKGGALAASGAAGTAVAVHDVGMALALSAVSGVCGVIGAMYYLARADETVRVDLIISVAMAFVIGASVGPGVGEVAAREVLRFFDVQVDIVNQRMIGGAFVGLSMTPALRWLIADGLAHLARSIAERIGGKRP